MISFPTPLYSLRGKRIWVAGHGGMVGSAIVRQLASEACTILTVERTHLDLANSVQVRAWLKKNAPHAIFMAAAKVGGIVANESYPADFLLDNLGIQTSVLQAAHEFKIEKLLFLGSSCIYPRLAPQPITEDALLTGALEETNQWYAIAKIAGIKLSQAFRRQYGCDFISAMPTNLYGPGDNFNLQNSHVIPALLRKAHEAKLSKTTSMTVWGTGSVRREFLHVDDCARALVFLMKNYSAEGHVNVGSGVDMTIDELARTVMTAVGFEGELVHDKSKPDGTPRKLLSNAKLSAMGWAPEISLLEGLKSTYQWFVGRTQVRES